YVREVDIDILIPGFDKQFVGGGFLSQFIPITGRRLISSHSLGHGLHESLERKWLEQIIHHIEFVPFECVILKSSREYDPGGRRQGFQKNDSRHFGQMDIQKNQVDFFISQKIQGTQCVRKSRFQLKGTDITDVFFKYPPGWCLVFNDDAIHAPYFLFNNIVRSTSNRSSDPEIIRLCAFGSSKS